MLGLSDMVLGCVPPMVRCKCWVGLSNMVAGWASHGKIKVLKKMNIYLEAKPTTNMK